MNPQPFEIPPRSWMSRLTPRFVDRSTHWRNRELRLQGIESIDVTGGDIVAGALQTGSGVLLISNHSYHYDSYAMIEAGRRSGWYPHIMTAWQVFTLYGRVGQWFLQKHGCFSINREGTDKQAIRHSVSVLTRGMDPLLIYPEGDIYHSNDRVMPFREGAASIALMAQRKQERPVLIIPCAMKCFYTRSPEQELHRMMDQLEAHIGWRPDSGRTLLDRIYRFGNGFLALKEVEYLGEARGGTMRERISFLANAILTQVRDRHQVPPRGKDLTERIRFLRIHLIGLSDQLRADEKKLSPSEKERQSARLQADMQDLFFVTQLSSYHGDYSAEAPTMERMAETIDKFEEDVFALQSPTPRGKRVACVRFGKPVELSHETASAATLTVRLEQSVQELLNSISRPAPPSASNRNSLAVRKLRTN